ncbi:hypothetical protein GGS26DRAFT_602942 [Hypomontagnella submonticulosa]|nr:hypothetical protein GGS26DRAFT_602942 [Hypomontagnella submonticulosa]
MPQLRREEPEQGIELQNIINNAAANGEEIHDDAPDDEILPPYVEVDPNPMNHPAIPPGLQQALYPMNRGEYKILEKEVRWRVWQALIPFLCIMCLFIQLDSAVLRTYQPYFGHHLGFTEEQYKSMEFARGITCLLAQIPSNLILYVIEKPSTYLCNMLVL